MIETKCVRDKNVENAFFKDSYLRNTQHEGILEFAKTCGEKHDPLTRGDHLQNSLNNLQHTQCPYGSASSGIVRNSQYKKYCFSNLAAPLAG